MTLLSPPAHADSQTPGAQGVARERAVVFRDLVPEIPSTTYATFGLYKYPAKFIPQVIAYALKAYAQPGMSVFDPFAGYGTVGTVARIYDHDYELWDLNPLLGHLHPIAVMPAPEVDADRLIGEMRAHREPFVPDWLNVAYWYPESFLPLLSEAWGFYHSLDDEDLKKILLIPLIKTTRKFSYNDERRQKLSRSTIAQRKMAELEQEDWREVFFQKVRYGVNRILAGQGEYKGFGPGQVRSTVKAGIDGLTTQLQKSHDILITSPPYLQAQEYIRASKMDLFWLGYSEDAIRELGKREFPYQDVPAIPIHSATYYECLKDIWEPHMIRLFERYFFGVLGTLSRLQESISKHLLLFVGPATVRGKPIPIDRIFIEHFEALGWNHDATLIDTIAAKTMFSYKLNPATGVSDRRMSTEHLVVLSRS